MLAPFLDTVIEDALLAFCKLSSMDLPCCLKAMKYPVKVSPAAVVSTASTLYAGWKIFISL